VTGYYIRLGYNSGYSSEYSKEQYEEQLLTSINELCIHTHRVVSEVLRLEPTWDSSLLEQYTKSYGEKKDLTLTIARDEEGELVINQCASGGEVARKIKESLRRAFCRLIMEEMHKKGIEVSVTVC